MASRVSGNDDPHKYWTYDETQYVWLMKELRSLNNFKKEEKEVKLSQRRWERSLKTSAIVNRQSENGNSVLEKRMGSSTQRKARPETPPTPRSLSPHPVSVVNYDKTAANHFKLSHSRENLQIAQTGYSSTNQCEEIEIKRGITRKEVEKELTVTIDDNQNLTTMGCMEKIHGEQRHEEKKIIEDAAIKKSNIQPKISIVNDKPEKISEQINMKEENPKCNLIEVESNLTNVEHNDHVSEMKVSNFEFDLNDISVQDLIHRPNRSYTKKELVAMRYTPLTKIVPSCIPEELLHKIKTEAKEIKEIKGIKVIKLGNALDAKIQLKTCSNAWRPKSMKDDDGESQTVKQFRSILNKITPEKFEKLMSQIEQLAINTIATLQSVIDTLFETAVNDQAYSEIYAKICKRLESRKVKEETGSAEKGFRSLLLERCQKTFFKFLDCEEKNENEEQQLAEKRKRLGNIRLIGELFNNQILNERILHDCVTILLKKETESGVESACLMLTIAGERLEPRKVKTYLQKLSKLQQESKLSSRIKFMIRDLLEIKSLKWNLQARVEMAEEREREKKKELKEKEREREKENTTPHAVSSAEVPKTKVVTSLHIQPLMSLALREEPSPESLGAKRGEIKELMKDVSPKLSRSRFGDRGKDPRVTDKVNEKQIENLSSPEPCLEGSISLRRNLSISPSNSRHTNRKHRQNDLPSRNVLDRNNSASPSGRVPRFCNSPSRKPRRHNRSVSPCERQLHNHKSPTSLMEADCNCPETPRPSIASVKVSAARVVQRMERDDNEGAERIVEGVPQRLRGDLVFESVNLVVERCFRARKNFGGFLERALRRSVLHPRDVRDGLTRFARVAGDLEVDIPRLWFYLSQVCSPLLRQESGFPPRYFDSVCEAVGCRRQTAQFLTEVAKEMSEERKSELIDYMENSDVAQRCLPNPTLKSLFAK